MSYQRAAAFWLLLAAGSPPTLGQDPLNTSYLVEGVAFTLRDGRAEGAGLHVSGPPVFADLNGDGAADAAVVLVHEPGGSGTFFYVAAAVRTAHGYRGTNAVRVGDRISPLELRVEGRTIVYTYADRLPQESFAVRPAVVRSKRLMLTRGTLQEVP
ncbi:MAG: hypothetical protein ACREJE_12720 [Candidatus Rokuibacteriota bacterium]